MKSEFLVRVLTDSSQPLDNGYVPGCGMSTTPSFYSGRGATRTDLSSAKLERIYQAIERNVGLWAATAFARMVRDIPVLSATDFLLNLERFVAAGWRWKKSMLDKKNGICVEDFDTALGTCVSVLAGSQDRDETVAIRYEFLLQHDLKDPRLVDSVDVHGRRYEPAGGPVYAGM